MLCSTEEIRLAVTEPNVRHSDGTVVFSIGAVVSGDPEETIALAQKHGKPVIHISRASTPNPAKALQDFIRSSGIRLLNVNAHSNGKPKKTP